MSKNKTEQKNASILSPSTSFRDSPFVRHGFTSLRKRKHKRKRTKKSAKNMNYTKSDETNTQINMFED